MRTESTSTFPDGVTVSHVDFTSGTALEVALRGHDFLMITLAGNTPPELHSRIVKAAIAAKVPYIMPNSYGYSVTNTKLAADEVYTGMSAAKAKEVEQLGGNWIAMVCGCWYEPLFFQIHGDNSFGIDIKKRSVTFFDDGLARVQVSTWNRCAEALASLLSLPESGTSPAVQDWKNKDFGFQSWNISQRDILDSLNRVMGLTDADWAIRYEKTEDRVNEGREALKKGDRSGFAKAMYSRFFYKGGDTEYETCNKVLGLEDEEFDEQTKRIVDVILAA